MTVVESRIEQLRKILPEIFSEDKIDWEKLKQSLGESVIDSGSERYGLNWAGKRAAFHNVQTLSTGTLVLECDSTLYLVRESKGSVDTEDLRTRELARIHCGKAHFDELKIDFEFISSAEQIRCKF